MVWVCVCVWGGCTLYITVTADTQTDLIPGSEMSQQHHHRPLCVKNIYPADTLTDRKDSTDDNTEDQAGCCAQQTRENIKKCWTSKLEKEEGHGAGCLYDPLAL